jgi:hypothetical protein
VSEKSDVPQTDDPAQEETWELLYTRAGELLQQFGTDDYLGNGDFWIIGDNYGHNSITVAFNRLRMLQPALIKRLQVLLVEVPGWEIYVSIDIPEREDWPQMGLLIRPHEIVDELKREYLPGEYRDLVFA